MVVSQLGSVVRLAELRDVGLERVFCVGCEVVAGDDIVDRRLRIRARVERIRQGTVVGRHGALEATLFVHRRRRERGLKRLRSGGGHTHSYDTEAYSTHRK